ncbi:hypothetical protein [Maribellus sediminis]|uniref:hypothetical protein n=1 Tax=Maribellus sediminis TaxID=2696285 RepID=UPI001430208D|nr:hypothetical protein [Maribellus sediminis]
MKTKLIVLLCLFTGLMWTDSFAQNNRKASQGWASGTYWSPVYCDGEMVDFLEGGTLRIHYVTRIKPYVYYKEMDQLKGEVTSSVTGEVFQVREIDKVLYTPDMYVVSWKFNLIGNMGTHYHGNITMDMRTGDITVGKTVCN